ncbi:hypothetical protein BMR10_09785 [Methylococcaceae bacterium CS4]|nr:hypothetical protein BMR10_09785 [Methylococcaceae bacterium CS4]
MYFSYSIIGKLQLLNETIRNSTSFLKDYAPEPGCGAEIGIQARHATSRNSGTPVAVIRSPTQRIGDAPAALRPPQTEHKAAQSWLPQMALRLFGIKF